MFKHGIRLLLLFVWTSSEVLNVSHFKWLDLWLYLGRPTQKHSKSNKEWQCERYVMWKAKLLQMPQMWTLLSASQLVCVGIVYVWVRVCVFTNWGSPRWWFHPCTGAGTSGCLQVVLSRKAGIRYTPCSREVQLQVKSYKKKGFLLSLVMSWEAYRQHTCTQGLHTLLNLLF